jgi:hypothetical protein
MKEDAGIRNLPAKNVSWQKGLEFRAKCTRVERDAARLAEGYHHLLPKEAQRESMSSAGSEGNDGGKLK